MDKREIRELLVQVKIFFPRFSAVEQEGGQFRISPAVTDSWYDRIGWMEKPRAMAILDGYMEAGETKTPGISLWMQQGKTMQGSNVWHSAILDRRHGVIVWTPEGGRPQELPVTFDTKRGVWTETEYGYDWWIPEVDG